ncbi:MAG: T9SS C-terminal target domain-containing protein [Calditrichaeota bacterium]|nr:MAG: T9SS C-terminal target domain-containing protein [Calditrichota bacterium]
MTKSLLPKSLLSALLVLIFSASLYGQEVEPIGGPYAADSATVVLLHFDDSYVNESDLAEDATPHGASQFFAVSALTGLNQSLYLQNDAATDSSFLTIADNDNLDLADDWTMEAWFNVQTFGTDNSDHRFAPVIFWKPGVPTFDQGNYFMEMFGDVRWLSTGYSVSGHGWPSVQSPINTISPQTWYHGTMIRDTKYHVVVQMVHDSDLNLLWSGWFEYDPVNQAQPNITDLDFHIGTNGSSNVQPSFFDGFMDEIRISNVVRNFAVPPVIVEIAGVPNQTSDAAEYPPVYATVGKVGGSDITSVQLNYSPGGADWFAVDMTVDSGDRYMGSVPLVDPATIVYYYISAENADGQRSTFPIRAEDAEAPVYLTFAVEQPVTQTLGLEFEEGTGAPVDSSSYGHLVNTGGFPTQTDTSAAVGMYSMDFHADSRDILEISTPLIGASEEFTLDFWMNPTDLDHFWGFVVNKPAINIGWWGENTFEIIWGAWDDPGHKLTAGKWSEGEQTRITLDHSLELGKWYRVIYEIRNAPEGDNFKYYLMFQLNDENDQKIISDFAGFNIPPAKTIHPMRVGEAAGRGVFYNGKIDAMRTYNYATKAVSVDAPPNLAIPAPVANQDESAASYTVNATVGQGLGAPVSAVKLYYNAGGDWMEADMADNGDGTFSADVAKQDAHTVVYYYVTAENSDGFKAVFPEEAEHAENPHYLSFAVEVPNEVTVALSFEEGEGVPADGSMYQNWVNAIGAPTYSTDAIDGTYSMDFNGASDYLEVQTPLAGTSEEFTVEFWMNPRTMDKFWSFVVAKPALRIPFWGENTFEVIYGAFDDPNWKLTAGVWTPEEGGTRITLPTLIEMDKWYRVIFEVSATPDSSFNYMAVFDLRDANNEQLSSAYAGFNVAPAFTGTPLNIGKAGGPDGWPDWYDGKIDRLRVYNYAAKEAVVGVNADEAQNALPATFSLSQNYPNPFNPTTEIQYALPRQSKVTLVIYDMLGRQVKTLVDAKMNAGNHIVRWNGTDRYGRILASGMYFYQIKADNEFVKTNKMILMK